MRDLASLLSQNVRRQITNIESLTEIRLRRDKPLSVATTEGYNQLYYRVQQADIDYTLAIASENSIYAVQDAIINGYLSCAGGIRIGVCGEGVYENNVLKAVKNINSLTIRIPHEIKTLPIRFDKIIGNFENTLIVSPPGGGKTTLLRETARRLSNRGERVLIIDERLELTATSDGKSALDIGSNTDVMVNILKLTAYKNAVRADNPSIIVTDELFGEAELDAIADCIRSGVKVLASMHGNEKIIEHVPRLITLFKNIAILDSRPSPGTLVKIINTDICGGGNAL